MPTAKQTKLIHAIVNRIPLTDEQYRYFLNKKFGASSSKELNEKGTKMLIEELKAMLPKTANALTEKQLKTIYYLIKNTPEVRDWKAFVSSQNVLNKKVYSVEELSKDEASRVINAFKRYHR